MEIVKTILIGQIIGLVVGVILVKILQHLERP